MPSDTGTLIALNAFGLEREEIIFAAFAGWDAAGAKWFGFPTVWVNRLDSLAEQLRVVSDVTCSDSSGLVAFATSHR